jgi:prepilin-type processing-associated H-X9-DG protein
MYADENDSRIVNGAAGMSRTWGNYTENAWVGRCWSGNYSQGEQLPEEQQESEIRKGAMWPFVSEIKLFSCPTGTRGELVTYAAMDAVNGLNRSGQGTATASQNDRNAVGKRNGNTVLWLKRTTDMGSPTPAERMVYIDEGWVTPDSFAVNYNTAQWWDDPPVRHGDGTNVCMADGHADYWKWRGSDTIKEGRNRQIGHPGNHYSPTTEVGNEDLYKVQKACWGKVGYAPSF